MVCQHFLSLSTSDNLMKSGNDGFRGRLIEMAGRIVHGFDGTDLAHIESGAPLCKDE